MAEGREGGHSFDINDKLGERQWGKAHTPPMSPWQGSTSPGGLSMPDETSAVDAEVARISRVAEKLGLRPLGVDKVRDDQLLGRTCDASPAVRVPHGDTLLLCLLRTRCHSLCSGGCLARCSLCPAAYRECANMPTRGAGVCVWLTAVLRCWLP